MPQKEEYNMEYDSYTTNCSCSKCIRKREKKRDCQCKSCRRTKTRACEYSKRNGSRSSDSERSYNSEDNKDKCKREETCYKDDKDKCKRERYCCQEDKDDCKSGKMIIITIK